ncbi:DDE_3 domain-containing protein [Trichonephila clavipes]|nr:DDE_3 domain-containing protein [Trichonephila clavipes]
MQTLFPGGEGNFQDDNAPIHVAGLVQSWFDEHEDEVIHLPWPAQLTDLNRIEPLGSILKCSTRNRDPPRTSISELSQYLHKEWHHSALVGVDSKLNYMPKSP